MADKQPIITKWGGMPPPTHPSLVITDPARSESDLTLTSEVLVQGFLSFQKHQYIYRVNNGLKDHVLRVDWKGPGVKLDRAAKNESAIHFESFFSPQLMKTTASAEAIADEIPFKARPSHDARADAYVPWTSAIRKTLRELLGEAIASKLSLKNAASVALASGVNLAIVTELSQSGGQFKHQFIFENLGTIPFHIEIAGLRFNDASASFELPPSSRRDFSQLSSEEPAEREVALNIDGHGEIRLFLMIAENMLEAGDKKRRAKEPAMAGAV